MIFRLVVVADARASFEIFQLRGEQRYNCCRAMPSHKLFALTTPTARNVHLEIAKNVLYIVDRTHSPRRQTRKKTR